jgi:hypothetical protein
MPAPAAEGGRGSYHPVAVQHPAFPLPRLTIRERDECSVGSVQQEKVHHRC